MAYEYNLRGLFRPQLDQLPLSEQLVSYQQRDMTASHLYRVGGALFGSRGITTRRRLIDSSLYSSTDLPPHATLLNGPSNRRSTYFRTGCKSTVQSYSDCSSNTTLPTLFRSEDLHVHASSDLRFSKLNYLKWIADRQRLRGSVEGLDALEHWLMCKEQTPMECFLLTNLHTKKVSDEILDHVLYIPTNALTLTPNLNPGAIHPTWQWRARGVHMGSSAPILFICNLLFT